MHFALSTYVQWMMFNLARRPSHRQQKYISVARHFQLSADGVWSTHVLRYDTMRQNVPHYRRRQNRRLTTERVQNSTDTLTPIAWTGRYHAISISTERARQQNFSSRGSVGTAAVVTTCLCRTSYRQEGGRGAFYTCKLRKKDVQQLVSLG